MSTLVRSGKPDEHDVDRLRARATELETLLAASATEAAKVKAALDAFKIRYRHEVGLLHEQLEELEYAIAEAEGEVADKAGRAGRAGHTGEGREAHGHSNSSGAPRLTSDAVRRLFRDVAKAIHPDLARDDHTRDRRHSLMIEANKAYELGDEEQLRWILQAWERSPEAVQGSDPEAVRQRLERRIAQIEEQLELFAADLTALEDTPLWKLKTMVDEQARRGKDLVRDMVRRLKRDILVATNRLEAIRPPGTGACT